MTGRTHDLAAFSALSYIFITRTPTTLSLGTLVTAIGVNFLGGLYPDLDKASSDLWHRIPGGSIFGALLAPLMGGHRMISHSLLGFGLTGWLLDKILTLVHSFLVVDMTVVWAAFMIGYGSHLLVDFITKDGIPLLFPLPINFGLPPMKHLRITTGGKLEKYIVYPSLLLGTGYLYFTNYSLVLNFFQQHLH